jgi:Fic family protein
MGALEMFLNRDRPGLPVLVKAALAHVQFETIHPFLDGNGRLGRLLITFLLCAAGVLREPILYLSLYFKSNRRQYYELLDRVRTSGDWETWVEFFLTGVRDTSNQAAETARRILTLLETDRRKIEKLGRPAASVLRIQEYMQRHPIVSIPAAAHSLSISAPTVAKAIGHMRKLGMLREITGKPRHRRFVYAKYLAVLNQGTEAL